MLLLYYCVFVLNESKDWSDIRAFGCVCVCDRERERERETKDRLSQQKLSLVAELKDSS